MFRLLHEAAVAEDLEVDQAAADDHAPKQKHTAEDVKPEILAAIGSGFHEDKPCLAVWRWLLLVGP
jgi:hypothetical protein